MFTKKSISKSLIVLIGVLVLSIVFSNSIMAQDYTLNVGMAVGETNPMYKGAMQLKENVEARTDGDLEIRVFPNSQLGSTDDLQEQAKMGANVAVITDAGRLADVLPEIGILNAPYIATNYEDVRKIVLSDMFRDLSNKLTEDNYKVLSFNWYQGARHFLTNKRVENPSDLNGLKIRTPGSPVWRKSVAAMGATPTPLDWSEVYPGIQQGVIDGAEAQHTATYGSSLYEVVDYINKTGHFQLMTGLVVGTRWFNSLPEDYQNIILEESINAGDYASELTIELGEKYEAEMKEMGVTIVEPNIEAFVESVQGVYEEFGYNELKEEIKNKVLN
ncbi:C4-dicarboxylate TRAP transporter substrate-binding protein [Halanaerobium salsuginis]|uniref:Tripartite ATP-independent transporter solute receptor, DctP family n=1 Tax=Halanaerobium salsuginis TaxID=29563 RepID=A0A1I4NI84_9FIRM|nr:C4-dicarboxylate TRAP transporter substrate-binding protein [Halanaerobium salsuginis]SFM14893.1 tripartite ATP-independent transporter solute receptor, DctP family [Halanaerobium salsuginis]